MSEKAEVNATNKYNLKYIIREKEEIPDEISNDVFDRQRVMKNFDQSTIEQQHVFVLGVGGIGSSIAMSLVRMGVDSIYLLDRDVIEASNLNRQILFGLSDVGKSKVKTATQHLKEFHNLRTNIYDYHLDAVTNWSTVVEIAKKCTVIFNNIDYGAVFDYAVNSLCKSLNIIYVSGSTYANSIEINLFSGQLNDSCWACHNSTHDSFKFNENTLLDERQILKMLLPDTIQSHESISFIPKDKSFSTRTVGSWIGVCVSGSCLIVNTWIQYLIQNNSSFHNWTQLNLSMYDGGYSTAGFPNEQNPQCLVCSNAKQM